jgi:hypothetical protein
VVSRNVRDKLHITVVREQQIRLSAYETPHCNTTVIGTTV